MDLSEVEKFETPAKTLKPSEAIRIGARTMKPHRGWYFNNNGGACLFGTIDHALHGHTRYLHGVCGRLKAYFSDDAYEALTKRHDAFMDGESLESIAEGLEALGY